jgi:hypothetical protein
MNKLAFDMNDLLTKSGLRNLFSNPYYNSLQDTFDDLSSKIEISIKIEIYDMCMICGAKI